jgi:hypothetical protein
MEEHQNKKQFLKLTPTLRTILEATFIVFLFYSNLLMGEFTNSGKASGKGLVWAMNDIFTITNFTIAIVTAIIGYLVFDFLRNKL